jgi:hypothetical protein
MALDAARFFYENRGRPNSKPENLPGSQILLSTPPPGDNWFNLFFAAPIAGTTETTIPLSPKSGVVDGGRHDRLYHRLIMG